MTFRHRDRLPAALCVLLAGAVGVPVAATTPQQAAPLNHRQILKLYADDPSVPLGSVVTPGRVTTDSKEFHVRYAGAGGAPVDAVLYVYGRASEWHPAPAIVLIHGLSGADDEMDQFGFFLAATGYAVLIVDESRRNVAGKGPAGTLAGLQASVVDIRRSVDFLRTQIHVNPKRIAVIGFGPAGIVAADSAAVDFRIRAVVLVATGGGLAGILQRSAGLSAPPPAALIALAHDADPALLAPSIAPRSILMINGKADAIVPITSAKALYNAARSAAGSSVEIDWIPDAGHRIGLDDVYDYVTRPWLEKHL